MRKHIYLPPLTMVQLEIVNGLLLGDGSLHHVKNTKFNWKLTHGQSQHDDKNVDKISYMEWIFNSLSPYSSKLTKCLNKSKIVNVNGKIVNYYGEGIGEKYCFTTHCQPIWTELSKKWYLWENNELVLRNNKIIKTIPSNLILTPLTVCVWLMDDGAVDAKRGNIVLHTNGFTFQECEKLSTFLKRDIGVLSNVRIKATGPIIYFGVDSYKKLIKLIKPYVNWDCFKYKIDDSYNKSHQGESHSQSKLTEEEIKRIIDLYNNGMRQKDIAKEFNVSRPLISHIVTGKSWKHLKLGKSGRQFKKLSTEQKILIFEKVKLGEKQKDIAKEFNIDQSTVSKTLKSML